MLARKRHELIGCCPASLHELDEGDDLLAILLIGLTDDGGAHHVRMLDQHVLDVTRVDVVAAADDPVHDVEVAVSVEPADVTSVQVAATEGFGRLLRRIPVPGHHHRSGDADLAIGARGSLRAVLQLNPDSDTGRGSADATGPRLPDW